MPVAKAKAYAVRHGRYQTGCALDVVGLSFSLRGESKSPGNNWAYDKASR